MAAKKKITKKKASKRAPIPAGKEILFLHVSKPNKRYLRQIKGLVESKSDDRVTLSIVADRILSNIKKSKKLTALVLK